MPGTPAAAERVAPHAPVQPRPTLGALQRAEAAGARAIAALPPRIKRLVAGRPVHRDGFALDLDSQLVVKLAERNKSAAELMAPQETTTMLAE